MAAGGGGCVWPDGESAFGWPRLAEQDGRNRERLVCRNSEIPSAHPPTIERHIDSFSFFPGTPKTPSVYVFLPDKRILTLKPAFSPANLDHHPRNRSQSTRINSHALKLLELLKLMFKEIKNEILIQFELPDQRTFRFLNSLQSLQGAISEIIFRRTEPDKVEGVLIAWPISRRKRSTDQRVSFCTRRL